MAPPHPDEFSNEMLEFLLKDPKLSEHFKLKPRLKTFFYNPSYVQAIVKKKCKSRRDCSNNCFNSIA